MQYYVLCVRAFTNTKGISPAEAFNYLYAHGGIDFLVDCYDAEHTLSMNDAVDDLTIVCKKNGGTIE